MPARIHLMAMKAGNSPQTKANESDLWSMLTELIIGKSDLNTDGNGPKGLKAGTDGCFRGLVAPCRT
jgi:hypothetical protein